ncbi:MAG: ACP phosphodiesterase [Flavobacteriaceae bacterium]
MPPKVQNSFSLPEKTAYIWQVNYLAHVYLSGSDDQLALGNFIADHIKGNHYQRFPENIQKGILLHRSIDSYTDAHPLFKQAAQFFFPTHRHYSRVLVDMYFDHQLARDWDLYHTTPLALFAADFYQVIHDHLAVLPESFVKIDRIIREQDWFQCYATVAGMEHILMHMDRRTRFDAGLQGSIEQYKSIQEDFDVLFPPFFKELREHVDREKKRIDLLYC